jgi:hypothetical protein
MNKHLYLILSILSAANVVAQTNIDEHEWRATLKVADEKGSPVPKASVKVSYYVKNTSVDIQGLTDTNGIFVATRTTPTYNYVEYALALATDKAGYYGTRSKCDLGLPYDAFKWNPTITLVLKEIGKPIGMYAKSVNLGMPVFDKPAGFDLMVGDWVKPYGKGRNADILFEARLDQRAENDADYKLTVSFPKAGDGIQEFTVPDAEKGSGLRSPHEAPADGYQSQWVQSRSRKPGKPETGNLDANRNYIFRVRTVLDQQGNVVSACYGKIYGDFLQFRYYFNPTPNSRNIEFDPKHNLLGGVQAFEEVTAP